MAESYRQKRLKELTGTGNEAGVPSVDANIPYRQRRLMELGFLPDSRPSTQLRQNLPSPFESGLGGLQNTTFGQAAAGNPSALQTYKQATGITIRPNDEKVQQQKRDEAANQRARDFFGSTIADKFLIPAADYVDNTTLGKVATRTSLSAANALNLYPDDNRAKAENRPSTGSRVADTAIDIGGALTGYASNPAGVGVAGQSLLTGPYRIADNLLATRAGMRLQNAVASPLSRVVSTPTANMIANQALRGGGAGALQGAAQAGIQGDASTKNIIQSAALGAGLGAVGDVAISGAGAALRRFLPQRSTLPTGVETPTQTAARQAEEATVNSVLPDALQGGAATTPSRARLNFSELPPINSGTDTPPSLLGTRTSTTEPFKFESPQQLEQFLNQLPSSAKQTSAKQTENRLTSSLSNDALTPPSRRTGSLADNATTTLPEQNGLPVQRSNASQIANELPEPFNPAAVKADDYVAPKLDAEEVAPAAANPLRVEDVTPTGETIIKPSAEINGLGIKPFQRTSKYDNLSTTTKSQLVSRQKREPKQLSQVGQRLYTNLVDDLNPVNNFTKYANRVLDDTVKADADPYRQALSSRGSDMIAKQITTDAFVDQNGNVVGQSLKDAIKDIPYKEYVSFEDYLINKHAITRYDRGEKVFDDKLEWTPEKGAQIITDYERLFPTFKQASDNLYEYNRNLVQHWLVDTGMISQRQADAYFAANPYYVPNKRYFTDLEKGGRGFSKSKDGFGNQSNPVKKYGKGGSQRQIISPIESIIENTDAFVKAANRNKVMQNFVDVIEQSPEDFKEFAEIVDDAKAARQLNVDKELTNPESEDAIGDLIQEATTDFQKFEQQSTFKRTRLDRDNIVRTMINGEPTYVKFNDPDLLNAMLAIGPESSGVVLRVLGKLTGVMKTLTTGINPIFNFTRNIFRDIPQSYVQSKTTNNPIQFSADLFTALADVARNAENFRQYKRVGGGHSSSIADNRNMLARSKNAILPQTARNLPGRAFRAIEDGLNVIESVPRLAEFKRSQKLGNSLQQAVYDANEITVNFKRRGALSKELDKIFPYWNAAMQGLDKSVRTFKDNPVRALVKTFMAITLPTMVMYSVNREDPLYQKLNNRTKDNFLLIPKFEMKNGELVRSTENPFYKIAKPQELGTLFSDIPERLMRQFQDEDPEAFRDFSEQLRTNFIPPGISGALKEGGLKEKSLGVLGDTIIGPFANVGANSDFAGRAIVPGYLENLSPELQSDARTSSLAKKIGESTGWSPKEIDYIIRQYSGFIGQIGLPAMSPANAGKTPLESIGNAFTQNITADPVYQNDESTMFYRYKEKLDQANYDKELREFPEWYKDSARKKMNRLSKDMSKIRKKMREVEGNTSINPDDKRLQLREFQQQINAIAEKGNEYAKQNNIPSK